MIKKITPYRLSLRNDDHMVIVSVPNYDPKSQRVLVSVNNKVTEGKYNPVTRNITAKLVAPSVNASNPFAALLPSNPDTRVKVFVYDFLKDAIIAAKLQEFEIAPQQLEYTATDELLTTSPVIMGNFDLKALAEKAKKEEGIDTNTQQQEEGGEVKENQKNTNIVTFNEKGTKLHQIKHDFVSVGESIAQEKRVTSAGFTKKGTVFVSQFKTEVASRDDEVWAYKNQVGTFEGTLEQAKKAFPDVDFSGLDPKYGLVVSPEIDPTIEIPPDSPLTWHPLNEFDAVKDNNGKPVNWDYYLDATQTALDLIGLIPGVGEVADIVSGTISLARGNYAEAAINFSSAIPFAGTAVAGAKILKKLAKTAEDNKGVYDLIVKNADDIQGYVGQSNDVIKRISSHFGKSGKLATLAKQAPEVIYKMPKSTKYEREIYEQFVILRKYGGNISNGKSEGLAKLLNKVNPVGGRFKLGTVEGDKLFIEEALKIAKKYNLPTKFPPLTF